MLYELNYPMLIERSINANPMVYVDVFLSKCFIHFFQSMHSNDIFAMREVYISNFAYCYGWDFLIQWASCYPSLGTFLFSITSFYSA